LGFSFRKNYHKIIRRQNVDKGWQTNTITTAQTNRTSGAHKAKYIDKLLMHVPRVIKRNCLDIHSSLKHKFIARRRKRLVDAFIKNMLAKAVI